ncbi:MAG: hypothetical protein LN413_03435 [Candidatus Thermoplasmatota archaeon]|nr:hypothetical protein [Candidatus Thermoplasmatota archaeon]
MTEAEGGHKGRRRPLSPQGKRVMLISAGASIGLAVVLGIVFLPILLQFEGQPRDPFYTLVGETTDAVTTVTVEAASFPRPFKELGFRLINGSLRHEAALNASDPFGPVSYIDADGDLTLNVGDYFRVQVETGRHYALLITLLEDPGPWGVGLYDWDT